MIDLMTCWENWLLMLLAGPLLFRTGKWAATWAALRFHDQHARASEMLCRTSSSFEWESRLMTAAVAVAAILLSFGQGSAASVVLMGWMAFRWWRFAANRRHMLQGVIALSLVAFLAEIGERL